MGSPRKRRARRALGNVLRAGEMNATQRDNLKSRLSGLDGAQRLRDLVEINAHHPQLGGGKVSKSTNKTGRNGEARIKWGMQDKAIVPQAYTRVGSGLIGSLEELNTRATARFEFQHANDGGQVPGEGEILRITSPSGTILEILFASVEAADAAEPLRNDVSQSEVFADPAGLVAESNFMSPRRWLIDPSQHGNTPDGTWTAVVDIFDFLRDPLSAFPILDLPMATLQPSDEGVSRGILLFTQTTSGPSGNTAIEYHKIDGIPADVRSAADDLNGTIVGLTGFMAADGNPNNLPDRFSGGASAADAPIFYGSQAGGNWESSLVRGLSPKDYPGLYRKGIFVADNLETLQTNLPQPFTLAGINTDVTLLEQYSFTIDGLPDRIDTDGDGVENAAVEDFYIPSTPRMTITFKAISENRGDNVDFNPADRYAYLDGPRIQGDGYNDHATNITGLGPAGLLGADPTVFHRLDLTYDTMQESGVGGPALPEPPQATFSFTNDGVGINFFSDLCNWKMEDTNLAPDIGGDNDDLSRASNFGEQPLNPPALGRAQRGGVGRSGMIIFWFIDSITDDDVIPDNNVPT